ncbi:MAG: ATP-NAD kinase [Candidatus Lokiarchaeota archaeon]|nr:ATP-NAD kinase [Candidatus Lokiarchaeota archaeon]
MGGAVGLKGTDGKNILEKARKLGAEPISHLRAEEFLKVLTPVRSAIDVITYPKEMGGKIVKKMGFKPKIIGEIKSGRTSADDTIKAARKMKEIGVKLIVFCGGDGTAQDILKAVSKDIPVLGIPTGVKIHSSCFALNAKKGAQITMKFLWEELPLTEAEVMDVDEEAFREGMLSTDLKGYLMVPYEPSLLQESKLATPTNIDEKENQRRVAKHVIRHFQDEYYYILGPGTTVKSISDILGIDKSLLGVDVLYEGKLVAKDVNEKELLNILDDNPVKIVVSPIGRQGIIFGRGNLQISPKVIKRVGKENIIILATHYKISNLPGGCMMVDTRDSELDSELKGYMRVIVDSNELRIVKIK